MNPLDEWLKIGIMLASFAPVIPLILLLRQQRRTATLVGQLANRLCDNVEQQTTMNATLDSIETYVMLLDAHNQRHPRGAA